MFVFSACSSSMLLVNKVCMHMVPAASFISTIQFIATGITCVTLKWTGLAVVDDFEWVKVKPYLYYVIMFVATIYCNMKSLEHSNVETIIVFRACTPIVVSFFDYLCYGRAPPSPRSLAAMLAIVVGALSYVLNDREFQVQGVAAYTWVAVWFLLLVFQLCYGKHLVTGLGLTSMWSSVLYTNGLSCVPTGGIGLLSGEYARLGAVEWTARGVFWLGISCVVGTGISWSGFKCQSVITATAYTVVGVVNKMLTVLLNVLLWDAHATSRGIASLVVCVLGGAFYQQAPLRKGFEPAKTTELASLVKVDKTHSGSASDLIPGTSPAEDDSLIRRSSAPESRGTV